MKQLFEAQQNLQRRPMTKKINLPREIKAKVWVDPQCCDLNGMVFKQPKIIAKSHSIRIFGKDRLLGLCQFTVVFHKIGDNAVIGVADNRNSKGFINDNFVKYRSDGSCLVFIKWSEKSKGFATESVIVALDMDQGIIEWKVGPETRHKQKVEKLKDKQIQWVPYIRLRNIGDEITIFN